MKIHAIAVVVISALTPLGAAPGQAQDSPAQPAMGPASAYIEQITSDPQAALAAATRARDASIADWPAVGIDALAEKIEHHAIAKMLEPMPASARTLLAQVWESHPRFMGALARVYTDANDGATVATIAQAIATANPEALEQYPDLAAAVCVVLDRPHTYPGLGAILPGGADVFDALVFAHQDRRVMALPLDELPAEILVYMTDTALTGEGIRTMYQDRRSKDPLELYHTVPYKQAGLLAGEPALPPEEFTFDRIAERGGLGPLRSFYAEQLGQAFGYPVALATGHLGNERFLAPVFLQQQRRDYAWNLEAIPDHPGLAFGSTTHPVTGEPLPMPELVVTADLARAGADSTREAWALLEAAKLAEPTAKLPMLQAAQSRTMGFPDAWARTLTLKLDSVKDDPDGPQRVLIEFFGKADKLSPLLATQLALDSIGSRGTEAAELLEWMSLTSRRAPHRYAAAQLAIGDAALAIGDRDAAKKAYEDLLNRQADATPLALDAFARLETMIAKDGPAAEIFEFYSRTHRRWRAPRTSEEAEARASAFMVIGERYEKLLLDAGRDREAERLRRRLDQALP